LFYYVGILVHGVIFGFFFVGGQVYVDKKAPAEIRAQAQGLIVLVCFGVGMLIGNFGNGAFIDSNASTSEPVIAGYKMPGVELTAVRLYGRALSDAEVSALGTGDSPEGGKAVEQADGVASAPIDLEDGLLASGDSLSALAGTTPRAGLTFAATVSLPEGGEPLSGTLFAIGADDDAMVLGVDEDTLFWRAGASTITQRVPLPRGKPGDQTVHRRRTLQTRQLEQCLAHYDGDLSSVACRAGSLVP